MLTRNNKLVAKTYLQKMNAVHGKVVRHYNAVTLKLAYLDGKTVRSGSPHLGPTASGRVQV